MFSYSLLFTNIFKVQSSRFYSDLQRHLKDQSSFFTVVNFQVRLTYGTVLPRAGCSTVFFLLAYKCTEGLLPPADAGANLSIPKG